jgi:hypothetical protein
MSNDATPRAPQALPQSVRKGPLEIEAAPEDHAAVSADPLYAQRSNADRHRAALVTRLIRHTCNLPASEAAAALRRASESPAVEEAAIEPGPQDIAAADAELGEYDVRDAHQVAHAYDVACAYKVMRLYGAGQLAEVERDPVRRAALIAAILERLRRPTAALRR